MPEEKLPVVLIRSNSFEKDVKALKKRYRSVEKDLEPLVKQLENGKIVGDRIAGSKYPVFKVRVKNSDVQRGKSGSYRVIYYIVMPEAIMLTKMYSKSDRANLDNQEIEEAIEQSSDLLEKMMSEVGFFTETDDFT
jgi:mRNA-degrading endonuclease RelE of RelBE toxin-antitoxin system